MKALEVKNLKKVYPSFTLDCVSFDLIEGRIMGLVGANGAGKSTTLKGILGLIKAEGEARVFGYDAKSLEGKSLVGYAGGGFRYYPHKTLKTVARTLSGFYPAWSEEKFKRYCEKFELLPDKKVTELSEGMKVKFALALALSHGAKLLVLDEPTSGLDPLAREEFLDILLALVREEGVTVLFSTHIVSDLERAADDIVLLSHGKTLVNEQLDTLKEKYSLAAFEEKPERGVIGLKPVKKGFEGLVLRTDSFANAALREPTLEEIIIHLERREQA
ncbi:MAG: ABC transporter ATP-binding protein [Clostridia bacterium]|nr:ABC transporter ATP-binding protein [Clostridia bacterium]